MKRFFFAFALLLLSLVSACTSAQPVAEGGLAVDSMTTSIGEVSEDLSEQRLTYTLYLTNRTDQPVEVRSFEPLLSDDFRGRVRNDTVQVTADQTLAPGDTAGLSGELLFDAGDLSKADIEALQPFLTGVRVTTDTTLPLPPIRGE